MMNNETKNDSMNIGTFSQYLLGESVKNILIRLSVILSSIILVWSGIMLALIIHTKYQRMKQMQKLTNSHHHHHHHLHDSTSSLNKTRSHRNHPVDATNSSRCFALRRLLSQLKDRCFFWPSARQRTDENYAIRRSKPRQGTIPHSSTKVQFVVEAMSRKPFTVVHRPIKQSEKVFVRSEIEISNVEETKTVEKVEKAIEMTNVAVTSPIDSTKRLYELHQLNKKATLLFHPLTRRLSNIHSNAILPPVNNIQKERPSYMVSSARELTSRNDWKWTNSFGNESANATDLSLTSSTRHIPLVMITDTSSSNTNIVELETFEDQHRLIGDIERRLSRELRASYRPRHST